MLLLPLFEKCGGRVSLIDSFFKLYLMLFGAERVPLDSWFLAKALGLLLPDAGR
jgi:hypothetical protein